MINIKTFLFPESSSSQKEILSGMTVALALIPEAIAFSIVAHVNPAVGLFATFFMCLITSLIGGRPGMISGATGSMAIVIVALVSQYGVDYLFATILLTGIFQILIGVFKLNKVINILPRSVMIGFINGLAIVIFLAQIEQFKHTSITGSVSWLPQHDILVMSIFIIITMFICFTLPKFLKSIPAALAGIIIVTIICHYSGVHTRLVQDMMNHAQMDLTFPKFHIPEIPFNTHSLAIILPYSLILTIIGLSESLMSLLIIDDITKSKGKQSKECISQGLSNIVCGFFKSMGGCAMLGQSMININNGARGRLSGIIASVTLLFCILVFWPVMKIIPLAALIGVMFVVVIETFAWETFRLLKRIPIHDAIIILAVTMITVATDLAIAVIVGIIIASLEFVWRLSKNLKINVQNTKEHQKYSIQGIVFFGSSSKLKSAFNFNPSQNYVVIDMSTAILVDYSAVHSIQYIIEQYKMNKIEVKLSNLSSRCKELFLKVDSNINLDVLSKV